MRERLQQPLRNDDQLFFMHIPKCAGLTLVDLLENHFDYAEVYRGGAEIWDLRLADWSDLKRYRFIHGHYHYPAVSLMRESLVKIVFLRHPVERSISHYEFVRGLPDHPHHDQACTLSMSDFFQSIGASSANPATAMMGANFEMNDARSDVEHVINNPLNTEIALQRLTEFRCVGLVERFDESLMLLSHMFAWPPMSRHSDKNVTVQRRKQSEFDSAEIDRLKTLLQPDMQLYEAACVRFERDYRQMLGELVEQTYALYQPAFRHPAREIHYTFDQAVHGIGWYPPSPNKMQQGEMIRWSGPDVTSTLDLAVTTGHDLRVEFLVARFRHPDILDSLRLSVNDYPITLTRATQKNGRTLFKGDIPRQYLSSGRRFVRLTFEVNRTVTVEHPQGAVIDRRSFGLGYAWLTLVPISDSTTP